MRDELISDMPSWTPAHERAKVSSVSIQNVAWKISRKRWSIGMGGEKGSGRSVLSARHDDDDDGMLLCSCVFLSVPQFVRMCM